MGLPSKKYEKSRNESLRNMDTARQMKRSKKILLLREVKKRWML